MENRWKIYLLKYQSTSKSIPKKKKSIQSRSKKFFEKNKEIKGWLKKPAALNQKPQQKIIKHIGYTTWNTSPWT
jgi:hypothetical protein